MPSRTPTSEVRASEDFKKQMGGYGLTTAEILYRRPDHQWLLQTYVWQDYDRCKGRTSALDGPLRG